MDAADREWLAAFCNALPFVHWDRLVCAPLVGEDGAAEGEVVEIYGWIDREQDSRSDFVLLRAGFPERWIGYTSSSAERTEEMSERLFGHMDEPREHFHCERVETVMADLVPNAIRLGMASEEVAREVVERAKAEGRDLTDEECRQVTGLSPRASLRLADPEE